MKLALITPIPELDRFATLSKVHLVLPEHFDDDRYLQFYKYRRSVGDYVIMDNGAHEHAGPLPISELMMRAVELGPNEIVLPDVQRDAQATLAATSSALEWLTRNTKAYDAAGRPRLHIVPQGTSMDEWSGCRDALFHLTRNFLAGTSGVVPLPRYPIVGIAKHHEDLITGGITRLVASCRVHPEINKSQIHLLGWPRRLYAVKEVQQMYPEVRSVDTARPFTFAKMEVPVDRPPDPKSARYPERDVEYFTDAIPEDQRFLARANVNWFMEMAGDTQAVTYVGKA